MFFLGVGMSPCDVGSGTNVAVTIATQTGVEEAPKPFDITKLSVDTHCYECKVKYRDPRPKDLVMFLHAYTYSVRYTFLFGEMKLQLCPHPPSLFFGGKKEAR